MRLYRVIVGQRAQRSGRDCLLSDVEMQETADLGRAMVLRAGPNAAMQGTKDPGVSRALCLIVEITRKAGE
jgi:hypothetical protein